MAIETKGIPASKQNPVYTVFITIDKTQYEITGAVDSLSFSEQQRTLAKSVTIDLANTKLGNTWLSSLFKAGSRVTIFANDGERHEEVWRGFVWRRAYKSSLNGHDLSLRCYDNLIYLQESEDYRYISSGKSTQSIISSICGDWGIKLEYSYSSITHSKLALRGALSDILTYDLLNLVKDRTGKKYVITSDKDTMQIKEVGTNSTIYRINAGENAISTSSTQDMDGVVTKIKILGKADSGDRAPVEAEVSGQTSEYGTLQKIISRNENTSLADAKKEAQSIIDADGAPKWEYEVTAVDIPWIRKGDKVYINAGDITAQLIVTGIDRNISLKQKTMTLTVEEN